MFKTLSSNRIQTSHYPVPLPPTDYVPTPLFRSEQQASHRPSSISPAPPSPQMLSIQCPQLSPNFLHWAASKLVRPAPISDLHISLLNPDSDYGSKIVSSQPLPLSSLLLVPCQRQQSLPSSALHVANTAASAGSCKCGRKGGVNTSLCRFGRTL